MKLHALPAAALLLIAASCSRREALPSRAEPLQPAPSAQPTASAQPDEAPAAPSAQSAANAQPSAQPLRRAQGADFGAKTPHEGGVCAHLVSGSFRVATPDLRTFYVNGDDPLALVNRSPTGTMAPSYVPADLVSVRNKMPKSAAQCATDLCLRREAATAYDQLAAAMRERGLQPMLRSAFRSYISQCGTFARWAGESSACKAAQQSALPGHSQHQLGTVIDLFTEQWRKKGGGAVFRNGFGCDEGGEFLREHAWRYGWVLPYPIDPDDQNPKRRCDARSDIRVGINPATGYGHEAWHLRYLGEAAARAFHDASVNDPTLTLEQWLRRQRSMDSAAATELPVCDGCNCGACASHDPERNPCARRGALRLDQWLDPQHTPSREVELLSVEQQAEGDGFRLRVRVRTGADVVTQPPLFAQGKSGYLPGEHAEQVATFPGGVARRFAPIAGAVRVGSRSADEPAFVQLRALPTYPAAHIYDRANVALPAREGEAEISWTVPAQAVEVALLQGEQILQKWPLPH